jgi:nickel-dependent lactate racemase
MTPHRVRSGEAYVEFCLPRLWEAEEVAPAHLPPLPLEEALDEALRHPLAAPPLEQLARGCRRALLVVPDHTRPGPEPDLLPWLRDCLRRAGVGEMRLLIGTGLHRPMGEGEIFTRHGAVAAFECRARNHVADDPSALADLGRTSQGIPALFNREVVEADLVLSTGLVEPHQYAGFSGGYKTVCIGAAGESTIEATHGPPFLSRPGVGLGRLAGNPFQEVLEELARLARHRFCVNYVLDDLGRPVGLAAGQPGRVLEALAERYRPFWFAHLRGRFQVALVGVPHPKSDNLYQASRAATYVALTEPAVLEPGATIIVAAPCPEGAGRGLGEKRFFEALQAHPPGVLLERLAAGGSRAGEQRAWMVARVLQRHRVVVAGSTLDRRAVEAAGLEWAQSVQEALEREAARRPQARCLVVPDPFHRLPEGLPQDGQPG